MTDERGWESVGWGEETGRWRVKRRQGKKGGRGRTEGEEQERETDAFCFLPGAGF